MFKDFPYVGHFLAFDNSVVDTKVFLFYSPERRYLRNLHNPLLVALYNNFKFVNFWQSEAPMQCRNIT